MAHPSDKRDFTRCRNQRRYGDWLRYLPLASLALGITRFIVELRH